MGSLIGWVLFLVAIGFFTLLERKVLSYSQTRVGPNKVGLLGLLQPILDGVKLLFKESSRPQTFYQWGYWLVPMMGLTTMSGLMWIVPTWVEVATFPFQILMFLVFLALSVYVVLLSGMSGGSKYSSIGSVRGAGQALSYEVVLSIMVFSSVIFFNSWGASVLPSSMSMLLTWGWALMWFLVIVAESNRAPFDFSEGESELISGFNIEYGGGGFTLLFLFEYGSILGLVWATSVFFLHSSLAVGVLFYLILLARASFPRFRYDKLMKLAWVYLLPVSLYFLIIAWLL